MERIPPRTIADKKGKSHSWDEVRVAMRANVNRRFYRVNPSIVDDAVSDTLIRLMSYWQTLASSREEDVLTFEKALYYGQRFASVLVYGEIRRQSTEVAHGFRSNSNDETTSEDLYLEDEDDNGSLEKGIHRALYLNSCSADPTPDEVIEDMDLEQRARRVLEDLDPDELEDWFQNLLTERSTREQAEDEGVSQTAVQKRRSSRRKRAREKAQKYGLYFA